MLKHHPLFTPNPLFIDSKKWVIHINWWYLDFLLLVYFLLCWKLTFYSDLEWKVSFRHNKKWTKSKKSKCHQFLHITHILLSMLSGLSVKSGWCLGILFTLGLLLLWWKLTFYFMSYPLLEFHGTYSVYFLLF